MDNSKIKIDKTNFIVGAIAVVLPTVFVLIADAVNPGSGRALLNMLKNVLTNQLGGFYMWVTIAALVFCFAVAFSKYGKLKLGEPDEKPEYKTLPWIAMIFSAGIGAGVLWGGGSEWIYYMSTPPLNIEAGTDLAKEMAITYSMFHWGPSAWALYTVSSITISYMYFVKKKPVLKVSSACNGLLGKRSEGPLGNVVDIFIMVGLVTASATSLGLGTPMVGAGISKLTGIPQTAGLNLIVLCIVVAVFAVSSSRGLKAGMKKVSTFNVYIAIGLLVFVLVFGGYFLTTIESFTTSMGSLVTNFVRMSTYMEPFTEGSSFVADWTIFTGHGGLHTDRLWDSSSPSSETSEWVFLPTVSTMLLPVLLKRDTTPSPSSSRCSRIFRSDLSLLRFYVCPPHCLWRQPSTQHRSRLPQ